MRKYNIPIFIPHLGCPHDCTFCNQRKITGVDTDVSPQHVKEKINEYLSTVTQKDAKIEVAFFGGSFTGLDLETQDKLLSAANEFSAWIDGIRLSTRPDYINDKVIRLLKKHNVTTVELGVQSSDDEVLSANNRGHIFRDVVYASELIKNAGISLGHQMMVGMYGSSPQKDLKTVFDIVEIAPSCVRIYPVVTLRGTALEKLYYDGKYTPYSLELAAEISKTAVQEFRKAGIDVIRVGLHSSDELECDGNIVAGPYHQAFGEIVESLIFRDEIEEELKKCGATDEFEFICPKGKVSQSLGHRKMNAEYFMEKYNIKLKVRENKDRQE